MACSKCTGTCGCTALAEVRPDLAQQVDPCAGLAGNAPGNTPVTPEDFRCSLGVTLAPHIDAARRQAHLLGLRPYRVFLVWEERDRMQAYQETRRCELTPVTVEALDAVDLALAEVGLQPEGALRLTHISTVQVTEWDLRGYFDGEPIDTDGDLSRRFYYEVIKHERCEGEPTAKRRRYVLGAEPHLQASNFEWRVTVVDQEVPRAPDGTDQTFKPQDVPSIGGKVVRMRR